MGLVVEASLAAVFAKPSTNSLSGINVFLGETLPNLIWERPFSKDRGINQVNFWNRSEGNFWI